MLFYLKDCIVQILALISNMKPYSEVLLQLPNCCFWYWRNFMMIHQFFVIKGFWTIVFIFIVIVISTTFQPICPLAFFRCLLNSGTFTELRTMSFIESTRVTCSDSISHNQVQVLSIPVLLLACSKDWTSNLQMIVSLEA